MLKISRAGLFPWEEAACAAVRFCLDRWFMGDLSYFYSGKIFQFCRV